MFRPCRVDDPWLAAKLARFHAAEDKIKAGVELGRAIFGRQKAREDAAKAEAEDERLRQAADNRFKPSAHTRFPGARMAALSAAINRLRDEQ